MAAVVEQVKGFAIQNGVKCLLVASRGINERSSVLGLQHRLIAEASRLPICTINFILGIRNNGLSPRAD